MATRSTQIISISNQKGGVGKTTTTMNLGVALAQMKQRVLVIDGDPQGNLTSYLGVTPGVPPYEELRTLDEIFLSKRAWDDKMKSLYITSCSAGVDLIAGDKSLAGVEYYLFSRADREVILARFLDSIEKDYDYILIDTPPSLNLLTLNALSASDFVLIPVQAEFFSLEGIIKIREIVQEVKSRWNPKLEIIGVLPTQYSQRRKLTQEVIQALQGELGGLLFESMIHDNASIAESSGHAKSVIHYDRSSRGAQDYIQAARELLNRCQAR